MILYDACGAMFGMTDLLRRAQGQSFEDFGLGPEECPYEVVASGAFWRAIAIMANPPHNLCSSWRLPSNAHTSGISSHHRALSVTFCVRASMSIFWNGFRLRHPASMVWQNTPRAFPNVSQGFHAGIQVQRHF